MQFLDLAEDLIQQILPEIELHRDLVNFACTSRLCHQLVIPRHTEYRILRLGTTTSSHVWAHLARRTDLACYIREVDIEHQSASYPLEPSSLIDDVDRQEKTEEVQDEEMRLALGQMKRLKSFCWDQDDRYLAPVIFEVLRELGSIKHLCLDMRESFDFNEPIEDCGLWKMTQLRSLLITGYYDDWPSTANSNAKVFSNWLNSLTSLELLSLSPEMLEDHHASLFFPNLRNITIPAWHTGIDDVVLNFLRRHPGIEDLGWYSFLEFSPSSNIPINFLPNLRHFNGAYDFFMALVSQSEGNLLPIRKIESLSLGWTRDDDYIDKFCACSGIDHHTLRLLSLGQHQTTQDTQKLAAAFPMIQELSLPEVPSGQFFSFDEFSLGLEKLKDLRILYRDAIWGDLGIQKGGSDLVLPNEVQIIVDERIQIIARRCPNLVQISHPKAYVYDRRLVICRDDGRVSTRVESVPPSSRFETSWSGI